MRSLRKLRNANKVLWQWRVRLIKAQILIIQKGDLCLRNYHFFYNGSIISISSKISAYISHWQRRSYPLGIIPGFRVLLNNVIKIVSKKGNPYLISTTFTHIQLLDIAANSQNESTQNLFQNKETLIALTLRTS